MRKYYYYLLAVPIFCLFFGTNVFAGETYSTATSSDSKFSFKYVQSASIGVSSVDKENDSSDLYGVFNYEWTFNNYLQINTPGIGKYVYGFASAEIKYTIQNPDTRTYSMVNGIMSGQPIITETLKIYPYITTHNSGTYRYYLIYVFDGYQPQNGAVPGPTVTVSNISLTYDTSSLGTVSPPLLTANGTCTIETSSNLRYEDTPLNRGLVGLIAEGLDNSDKFDLMLQYLYDIKMNDIQYYQQLTSNLSSILLQLQNANGTLISILNELDLDFNQVQTVLDLFPSYRTQVLQYWQQLLAMNAQQSSAAAEIESQYQENEEISASLVDGLGELNLPEVDMNDLDILSRVDQTQKANFFGMLSIITNNSFITTLLLIICTGAIVGFILYGKKG